MNIGTTVHVKNQARLEDYEPLFWTGKVIEIHNRTEITVQDKGNNYTVLNIDNLIFKDGEYWEK